LASYRIFAILYLLGAMDSEYKKESVFIFAGEPSGDLHGAELIKNLHRFSISGVGGPRMRAQGMECIIPTEQFHVMGFSDVIKAMPRLWKLFYRVLNAILKSSPSVVILIDYPGFNMRIAKALRKRRYQGKIVQYISPTVWAWKRCRIKQLAESLDLLLTIFPFEPDYFVDTSLKVRYIGNPLIAAIKNTEYSRTFPPQTIGIFPGSRMGEVSRNLPKQLRAAELFHGDFPGASFCISVASESLLPIIEGCAAASSLEITLVGQEHSRCLMRGCRLAIATSGTVTLELAIHDTPTVVTYNLSLINLLLAKYIFRINLVNYCIVNIVCGEEVFPELIGHNIDPVGIYNKLRTIGCEGYRMASEGCLRLKDIFGDCDASKCAADAIKELLDD